MGVSLGHDDAAVAKDAAGQRARLHPSLLELSSDGSTATSSHLPYNRYELALDPDRDDLEARVSAARLDLGLVRSYGRDVAHAETGSLGEDLFVGMAERLVDRVVFADPAATAALTGRPALYLANHQVQIESMLFPTVMSPLADSPLLTIAKVEHRDGWVGSFVDLVRAEPVEQPPQGLVYFDQKHPDSMLEILAELQVEVRERGRSIFVHVEGELGLTCRRPVDHMSSVFLDFALRLGLPIVPVRFAGGLPVEPLDFALDFPSGLGRQDYWVGAPLDPTALAELPLKPRTQRVLAAINELGPSNAIESPAPADAELEAAAASWRERLGVSRPQAVALAVLDELDDPSHCTRAVLQAAREGQQPADPGPFVARAITALTRIDPS